MNEVTVDVEKTGAVVLAVDEMIIPDFVVKSTRSAHGFSSILALQKGEWRLGPAGLGSDQLSRLLSAPEIIAKKRAGRRLWSCSTKVPPPMHLNFDPMMAALTNF